MSLHSDPPQYATAFSVDEKSQIPALDRIRADLPLKLGTAGTTTREYVRNGAATSFVALIVRCFGRCVQRTNTSG